MNKSFSFFYIQILFIVYFIQDHCIVYTGEISKQEIELNDVIKELHSMYKDAFENDKTYISRRLITKDGNSHYTLHVQKLKEVDGVKTHNLRIDERSKRKDTIIYINNPVEARISNPFLSIDQFKSAMFERVEKQKKEFDVNRNLVSNANKQFKVYKHLENFPATIFDVKKHVKQVVDVVNNMKTKGNHKVNKKRKQKGHVSHTPKPVTKPRIMTATALPKVPDTETLTVAEEEITTKSTAKEETTTEATANEVINTETIADEKITIGTPVDEDDVTTQTASDEENTTQTIETTAGYGITTETIAAEEINTEMIINKEITTEMIAKEEIITEPVTDTEPTVRTTRTKQLRPFVFVGDR